MQELSKRETDAAVAKAAVEQALDAAKLAGATSFEASAGLNSGLSVSVRMGDVETLEYHRGQSVHVTVYVGHRKGSASTSDLSQTAIREAAEAAVRIARYTNEDPAAGLADKDKLATEFPELDLYHPWGITAEQGIDLAKACESAGLAADQRIKNSEGASVNAFEGVTIYGNSHGFLGTREGTRHSLNCSLIAEDESGMQRDYAYTASRVPEALASPESVGIEAAQRSVARLSARRLSTRKSPILFSNELSRGLLSSLVSAISGSALYRKASFMLDMKGEKIFQPFVRIYEDPFLPREFGSAAYDNEGVAPKKRDLVSEGVLQDYVLSSYSARRLGLETTGNAGGVHNLRAVSGNDDLEGLLKKMGTGLYVTELIGHGVNNVTGDYSRGAAGYWVENGELQYPVEEITIADNLRDMYLKLATIGNNIDRRGSVQTGSWLIEEMTIAGE